MRSSSSLLGRILLWIASEMLEILTKILKIIFKQNLFFCDFCDFCVTFFRSTKANMQGKNTFANVNHPKMLFYFCNIS